MRGSTVLCPGYGESTMRGSTVLCPEYGESTMRGSTVLCPKYGESTMRGSTVLCPEYGESTMSTSGVTISSLSGFSPPSVRQFASICLFAQSEHKCVVAQKELE